MTFWDFLEHNIFSEGFAFWSLVVLVTIAAVVSKWNLFGACS